MKRAFVCLTAAALAVAIAAPGLAQPPRRRPTRPPEAPARDEGAEATHKELPPLKVTFRSLSTLRLAPGGNLLAGDESAKEIKLISPAGKQTGTIKLSFGPESIDVAADGTIYCGGQGKLAKLSKEGKIMATADIPAAAKMDIAPRRGRAGPGRKQKVSGIAVGDKDLFVAFGAGWSLYAKSKLVRFDLGLKNPKLLAEGLRGCCQRCDIVVQKGVVYLAENSAHRVVQFDREGKILGKWGRRSRTGLAGFGSCCNPMNLCFGSNGVLYTAESGLARIKRYDVSGKFLSLVGYVGTKRFTRAGHLAASCSNIAVDVTPDGKRVYVMDYQNKIIRVLEKKE